jgi:uncharacterized protein (DUF433 family)
MLTILADPVPIRQESDGTLRVGRTRVLLELVINAFEDGATPETIVQQYSTLQLSDVYSVIAHYLNHREELAEYVHLREQRASETAKRIASTQRDLTEIRRRLLSSRTTTEQ